VLSPCVPARLESNDRDPVPNRIFQDCILRSDRARSQGKRQVNTREPWRRCCVPFNALPQRDHARDTPCWVQLSSLNTSVCSAAALAQRAETRISKRTWTSSSGPWRGLIRRRALSHGPLALSSNDAPQARQDPAKGAIPSPTFSSCRASIPLTFLFPRSLRCLSVARCAFCLLFCCCSAGSLTRRCRCPPRRLLCLCYRLVISTFAL
jgi:hypothetical protein